MTDLLPRTGGTIIAKNEFNAEIDADYLENAIKAGNKDRITEVLTRINNTQRQMIRTPYKVKYGKDLVNELKKKFSGSFGAVVYGLMETPAKYDAYQMRKAVKGLGTIENILIEVLCSRTNSELEGIVNQYQTDYGKTLESDIAGDTSGDFRKLLVSLLQGKRDESIEEVNKAKAKEDAEKLIPNEKRSKKSVDKTALNAMLAQQSFKQLLEVFRQYEEISGQSIEKAIEKEFSGDARQGFLSLIQCIENKPKYFAQQLCRATKVRASSWLPQRVLQKLGFSTKENDLIRVIVSRSEIDLLDICEEFNQLTKKPLSDWLKSECSSSYRDVLVAIVRGNIPRVVH
ncbi:hypothetical protein AB6A40_001605 [Gnathostoma spinigerum]|uniref:Annexin n=1 Tax=Gnathostoma spinigerum TaxID=75299 RepID=A0ABD6E6V8_9BILA